MATFKLIDSVKAHVLKSGNEFITYDFGTREPIDYPSHNGVDLQSGKLGASDVIAIADGTVISVNTSCTHNFAKGTDANGYVRSCCHACGNYVKLQHENGYYTRYLHLKPGSITVKVGQKVKAGDTLGRMGLTGQTSGLHLHFDVNDGCKYVDPIPYIQGKKNFSITDIGTVIHKGDTVRVKRGAKFINGVTPASFVFTTEYTVQKVTGNTATIGLIQDGVFEVTGAFDIKYLIAANKASTCRPVGELGIDKDKLRELYLLPDAKNVTTGNLISTGTLIKYYGKVNDTNNKLVDIYLNNRKLYTVDKSKVISCDAKYVYTKTIATVNIRRTPRIARDNICRVLPGGTKVFVNNIALASDNHTWSMIYLDGSWYYISSNCLA